MTQFTANVSPLIPQQFPAIFRKNGPNFVNFVKTYFQWMEQENGPLWFSRQYYEIKDIDQTMDQFIVYFKEKYLKNIQFATEADTRLIIKHALDIYRSKGTERCTELIFQLAFDKPVDFYYPSTDLFKLSDGQWILPKYLELSLNWNINIQLQQKEVVGIFSGARAFVDQVIERTTNGRYQDIAYISAVIGNFQTGEKIRPLDGSIAIENCPILTGSLNQVALSPFGTGINYTPGTLIPISSNDGNNATIKVLSTTDQSGVVDAEFIDGGWGYQINQAYANISFANASGTFTNGQNIYTYDSNNNLLGIGNITALNEAANAGTLTALILSGNLNSGHIYNYANGISANVTSYSTNIINPTNIYISNAILFLSNLHVTTSNLEFVHYFDFLDTITEPMATINYINATGALTVGANVFTYFANGSVMGQGTLLEVTQSNSTTGTVLVSIVSGNVDNTFYTTANAIAANLAVSNGYNDSTATGRVMNHRNFVTLSLNNISGTFIPGEQVFQMGPLSNVEDDQKISGWGTVQAISNNTLTINSLHGIFTTEVATVQGTKSSAQANITSISLTAGIINVTGQFFASPYSYLTSRLNTSTLDEYVPAGTSFSLSIANNLLYPQNVQINTDILSPYLTVALNASVYGFPANPTSNLTNGTVLSCLNEMNATIGKLQNIIQTGPGVNFSQPPFVRIDFPQVSYSRIYNDILEISGGNFQNNEIVVQPATSIQGMVIASNTSFLTVQRFNYSNDFVLTSNSTTTIQGTTSGSVANVINVDYDYLTEPMARNASVNTSLLSGSNSLFTVQVVDSGFGFVNGESLTIGSNGAIGAAIVSTQGTGQGYYLQKGGFPSDQKKIFDGYFWQNFSYQLVSSLMVDKYFQMVQELTHPAGTIMFGKFVYETHDSGSLNIENAIVTIT